MICKYYDCGNLATVNFGNGLTKVNHSAFEGCTSISRFNIASIKGLCQIDFDMYTSNPLYFAQHLYLNDEEVTDLVIPKDVTSIGKYTFYNCKGLNSVAISKGVTSIGMGAFYRCSNIETVEIPSTVESIGNDAFYNCSAITSVQVNIRTPLTITSSSLGQYVGNATLYVPFGTREAYLAADYWKEFKEIVEMPESPAIAFADANVKALCVANWDLNGDGELSYEEADAVTDLGEVFKENTEIRSFNELQYFTGLTAIGDYAFANCSGLTSIEIPNSVTTIGTAAFYYCRGLTSIDIPNSVTTIGAHAFLCCDGLTSIYIPNSVTYIGSIAFLSCTSLKAFSVDSANDYYKADSGVLFNKNGTELVCYPAGKAVDNYSIPNSVTTIGNDAFHGCSGLTSIEIPNGVTTIGGQAFCDCSGLTSINIPNSVTAIGFQAFRYCSGLTSIFIPNSVTAIGSMAFVDCTSLKSFSVDSANDYYKAVSGVLFNKEGTELLYYPVEKNANSYNIPNGVITISDNAFNGCSGLTSIVIPNGVTTIGSHAFCDCSGLTSIDIPNSVTTIGYSAFYGCDNLTSVTVEMDAPLTIVENTFTSRTDATLYVPAGSKAAYEAAAYWKEFKEIEEFMPVGYIFTAEVNGLQMQFRVTDAKNLKVETYGTYKTGPAIDNQTEGELVIPAEVNGYTVVGIGGWSFRDCQKITSVSLPSTLTYIGESAFRTCYGLSEVVIPEGVTTIGDQAFYAALHKVTLPSTLQEIRVNGTTFKFSNDDDNIVIVNNPEPLAINAGAFGWRGTQIPATLIVPLGSREAYQAADQWNGFKAIYDNPVFYSVWVRQSATLPYETKGIGNAGDEVTVPYRRYTLGYVDNTMLFKRDATNKQYNHRFTLSADNPIVDGYPYQQEILEYTFTDIKDVVYLSEAEDIEGMTMCVPEDPALNNALVRSSNAAAAYPADGNVEFVTLPAGIYQLTAVMYNGHLKSSPYGDYDTPWTFLADGEPIATLTNDIINFDEKTTEPFVLTKETTLAIQQKGELRIGLDLIYIVRLEDNMLYVDESPSVLAGGQAELTISLRNSNAVNMTEFYLQLPEGVTIVDGSLALVSDRSDKHQVIAQWNADGGYYHIVSHSSQNNAFKENDGALFTMMLEREDDMEAGSYEAKVMSILMSDTAKTSLSQQDFTFTIEVPDLKLGDVNGDKKINGFDIVEMVDRIMQRPSNTFHFAAADLNYDKKINGLDLVKLISLVLSQPISQTAASARSYTATTFAPWLEAEGNALTMKIDAADDYILTQCVVELDHGMQLQNVTADDRHVVAWQRIDERRYAVVAYSTKNEAFTMGEALLKLDCTGNGSVNVSNIMLVDTDRNERFFNSAAIGSTTGVNSIKADKNREIFDLQGRKVDQRQQTKGIYIVNGKKVVVKK